MSQPQLVLLVKFRTKLPLEKVLEIAENRADEFRALTGLQQKYYVQDSMSGEIGGLYLWDSPEAFTEYRDSELRATIAESYKTEGEPQIHVMSVLKILREDA